MPYPPVCRPKRLIIEAHQRSLWQVLLVYCGAALVAYQAVQALTEGLGLPQWSPAFALGLLIVLLPVVLATAFVHEVGVSRISTSNRHAFPENGVMTRTSSVFVLLMLGAVLPIWGQDTTELKVGRTVEGQLSAGGKHAFLLDLNANQVVFGEVNQENIDIVVTVYGPEGEQVARFDEVGLPWFWETVHFESSDSGRYRIELTPALPDSGHYAIRVDQMEPLATIPEGRLDQWVTFLDREDRPGGAIAVVRNGEITYARAFGMADLTYGIPFTTETASNIGSVSKIFTAFAIALLEKGGKLSLEDDVRQYIPELPDFGQPVTLLNLLNYTGGFREIWRTLSMQGKIPGTWSRDELIQLIQRQRELQSAPGAQFSYGNTGYILLAEVVGRATGVSFPEWMEENVFDPLEMEHTTIKTQSGQVIPNSAKGYAFPPPNEAWIEGDDIDAFYGASSIYTTVQDLTRWLQNFRDAHVGGPEVISRMTERGVLTNGDTLDYGLGLDITTYRGLRRYGHGGEDGNHFALLHYYPEIDAGVVFICSNRVYAWTLERIAGEFFGEHTAPEEAPAPESRESQEEEPTEIDPALLDTYAGRYYSQELEMLYTLRVEGGRLLLAHHRLEDYELQPREPDSFAVRWPFVGIRFERDNDGEITGFVAQNVLFEKLR